MNISVIIPSHNRSDALALTLARLSEQQFNEKWEVIVINNNCTDDTNDVVNEWQQNFPVPLHLVQEEKPGAAAARNAGARMAAGEYLVFIDNDILVEPDFLQSHLRGLQENPNCWIVGAIANLPEQENLPLGLFRKSLTRADLTTNVRESLLFTGANSSLPRRDFEKVNGFDENFHVASGEDQEMAMRASKQLGIKTLYAPKIVGIHNDWAGWTFEDFCFRQRLYARTDFFLWQKYGDEHPRLKMVLESFPADWQNDSINLLFRKQLKSFLGSAIPQSVLLNTCNLLEKSTYLRPLLWQFYKLRLAGAVNQGLKEGREHFSPKA